MTRRLALLVLVLAASACASVSSCGGEAPELTLAQGAPASLAALALEAAPPAEGDSLAETRMAFQTDGAGAAWLDGLTGPTPGAGLTVGGERVVDAWAWHLDADSTDLGPSERTRGIARPDFAVRAYAAPDTSGFLERLLNSVQNKTVPRLAERVTLLDRRGALLVEVPDSIGTVGFRPVAGDRRKADAFTVRKEGGALLFARTDRMADSTGAAVWTAVVAVGSGGAGAPRGVRASELEVPVGADPQVALGEMAVATPARLVVATGATPALARAAAQAALGQAEALRDARSARMADLLATAPLVTGDARTNSALNWALLSLDALVVRADSGRAVLLPGLPGMEPPTTGSTMETVPAFLDAGQWETARALLLTTARAQVFDRRLNALGRAPDVVPVTGDPVFATAEATPLFLAAAGDLVRATGQRSLVSSSPNFWFKTVFALRGIYERDSRNGSQTDTLGFLVTREGRGTPRDGDAAAAGVVRTGAPAEAQGALVGALRAAADFSGRPIMAVLFGRGAFDATAALLASQSLAAYAFGLPAFVLLKVLVPAFFAHGDTSTPVRVGLAAIALNLLLNLLFMVPLQHIGPALATSLSAIVNTIALAILLTRRGHLALDPPLRRRLPRIALAALAMAAALIALQSWLTPALAGPNRWPALAALIAGGLLAYALACLALRAVDLKSLRALARRTP